MGVDYFQNFKKLEKTVIIKITISIIVGLILLVLLAPDCVSMVLAGQLIGKC